MNLNNVLFSWIKFLLIRRAYKGYCEYCLRGSDIKHESLSIDEFKKFERWKIIINFNIYYSYFKGELFTKKRNLLYYALFKF